MTPEEQAGLDEHLESVHFDEVGDWRKTPETDQDGEEGATRLTRTSDAALGDTWRELTRIEDVLSEEQLTLAREEYGAYMERLEAQVLAATRGGGRLGPKV